MLKISHISIMVLVFIGIAFFFYIYPEDTEEPFVHRLDPSRVEFEWVTNEERAVSIKIPTEWKALTGASNRSVFRVLSSSSADLDHVSIDVIIEDIPNESFTPLNYIHGIRDRMNQSKSNFKLLDIETHTYIDGLEASKIRYAVEYENNMTFKYYHTAIIENGVVYEINSRHLAESYSAYGELINIVEDSIIFYGRDFPEEWEDLLKDASPEFL